MASALPHHLDYAFGVFSGQRLAAIRSNRGSSARSVRRPPPS